MRNPIDIATVGPLICLAAMFSYSQLTHAATASVAAPSFNENIAPIFESKCDYCHRPGQVASSLSLTTYDFAKYKSREIAAAVKSGRMPPWPADPLRSLPFANDRRLTPAETDTILRWAGGGAPEGPLRPSSGSSSVNSGSSSVNEEWAFPGGRKPDAIVKLSDVSIPAHGELPYIQQRVKLNLPGDRWIIAMQVRPGNAEVVHHIGITEITLPGNLGKAGPEGLAAVAARLGLPENAFLGAQPAVLDPASGTYDMLGVYTPGSTFESYAGDGAKLLKADPNAYIDFNIHFTTNGVAQHSHSELALWFRPDPPSHQIFRAPVAVGTLIVNGREILTDDPGTKAEGTNFAIPPIPAFASAFELIGVTAFRSPVIIYQLQPHAHMRAKSFRYVAVYPDGHELTLLTVPRYDFHAQLAYTLAEPLQLPAGSKLIVFAHYDNSRSNKNFSSIGVDPSTCGPDKAAYFRGENQSWDEMFSPLAQYASEAPSSSADAPQLIKAQGCLVGKEGGWILDRASSATPTASPSNSGRELKDNVGPPSDSRRFRLIGIGPFRPQSLDSHKVAVKGLLLEPAPNSRINVTSLQKIKGSC